MKRNILTIAGSDPSGGAGIQRDLKTFDDFGLRGLSVITAVTAQNHKKVEGLLAVPSVFVIRQIETLIDAYDIGIVKVGMLVQADIVLALVKCFERIRFKKLILDPIFISSSGYPLLDKKGIVSLRRDMLPLVTIVTPNLDEAAVLADMERVADLDEMKEAAIRIKRTGPQYVLVKGGHLAEFKNKTVDVLYDGRGIKTFTSIRIQKKVHGTGCVLSAAIASCLAKGMNMDTAVRMAKIYTTGVIKGATQRVDAKQ